MDLGPAELGIILAIVVVLFGGKKLPELARSLGQAKKEFESGRDASVAPAGPASTDPPGLPAAPATSTDAVDPSANGTLTRGRSDIGSVAEVDGNRTRR